MNLGLVMSTAITTTNDTNVGAPAALNMSRSVPAGQWMLVNTACTTPRKMPPRNVPTMRVKPPNMAAVKPGRIRKIRITKPSWPADRDTMRMPAMQASIDPAAHANDATAAALMPSRRDTSRESAVARMAMPRLVNRKKAENNRRTTSVATSSATWLPLSTIGQSFHLNPEKGVFGTPLQRGD